MVRSNFEKLAVYQLRPLIDELAPRLNAYLRSIGPVSVGSEKEGE